MKQLRLVTRIIVPSSTALLVLYLLAPRIKPPVLAFAAALVCFIVVFYIVHISVDRLLIFPGIDYRLNLHKSRQMLREIGGVVEDVTWISQRPPTAQRQLREIYQLLQDTLRVVTEDDNKHDLLANFLANQLLDTRNMLRPYHRLTARGIESGQDEVLQTEFILPIVLKRVRARYEEIHNRDTNDLSATKEMMEDRIEDEA